MGATIGRRKIGAKWRVQNGYFFASTENRSRDLDRASHCEYDSHVTRNRTRDNTQCELRETITRRKRGQITKFPNINVPKIFIAALLSDQIIKPMSGSQVIKVLHTDGHTDEQGILRGLAGRFAAVGFAPKTRWHDGMSMSA